jgi:hypothetical protein
MIRCGERHFTWNLNGTSITAQQSGGTITFTGQIPLNIQQVLRSVHFVTTATTGRKSVSFSLGESAAYTDIITSL